MNFDGDEVITKFEQAFGKPITDITVEQMRWLVNCIKHCRGRCRSNAALNNYLNRNFKHLLFKQEPVIDKKGEEFEVLSITEKGGKES